MGPSASRPPQGSGSVPAAGQATPGLAGEACWHTLALPRVAELLVSSPSAGLSRAEAQARLGRHGPNTLPTETRRRPWRLLLAQFADFMVLVLLAAALISGLVGDLKDALIILVIVALNALIGFAQEYRAERAMAALRRLEAPAAAVRREGLVERVEAAALVPGDLVLLEAGNVVPADLRLVECEHLGLGEALLTGESEPVDKHARALHDPALPVGDRRNMAYRGTVVTRGRGAGLVVATGGRTELGRIAELLGRTEQVRTPLQRRLAAFGARLAWAVLAVCLIVFLGGLLRGEEPVLMFLTAVSLAVAAIPEALPAVVGISLALGAARMARQNALVRRLPSVETLGSITYICSDKTGTLTENRMRVEALAAGEGPPPAQAAAREPWASLLRAMALCVDVQPDGQGGWRGDPTEVALVEAARAHGVDRLALAGREPRVGVFAFDAARRRMTTLHTREGRTVAYVKGAPEALLPLAPWRLTAAGPAPLAAEELLAEAEALASGGLRVLALAFRELGGAPAGAGEAEKDLVLLGLVGLLDPPRAAAAGAVAECKSAGITPVMITGDHPGTARAIARRLGIAGEGAEVLTGAELAALSPGELGERVRRVRVYARVDPEQKIRIVEALQAAGEFAAMTGDGVNDAPALRRADIGVAMGKGGTEVAREAAAMVLLDDDFATIVQAVRAGRRIYDNIRKFIKYSMTTNSGEVWVIFLAPFLGLPIPLLPIHILWVNLVTDGLPGLALAAEPGERDLMHRPPRPPRESIFAHGLWQHVLWVGLLMAGVCLLIQAWAWHGQDEHWRSMVFTVLVFSQLGHVLAVRSEHASLFAQGLSSNRPLLAAVLVAVAMQLAILYVPALNAVFRTEPLPLRELGLCVLASSVVFWAVEAEKALLRRRRRAAGSG